MSMEVREGLGQSSRRGAPRPGAGRASAPLKAAARAPAAWVLNLADRRSATQRGVVLMYHRVTEHGEDPDGRLVPALSGREFRNQMRLLRRRYSVVPAAELPSAVQRRRRGASFPAAVTFDDDSAHTRVAMPILRDLDLPATFFLSGASLHEPFSFWYERLQRACDRGAVDPTRLLEGTSAAPGDPNEDIYSLALRIQDLPPEERDRVSDRLLELIGSHPPDVGMSAAEVRALADAGFEIGFHTRRHDKLTGLDDEALARAMREGRDELEEHAGGRVSLISYPHGAADARVASAARDAGFKLGFTTEHRAVRPSDDPLLIGRLEPPWRSLGRYRLSIARALRNSVQQPAARWATIVPTAAAVAHGASHIAG
jgi:peptidoglycan/xylan/chitin deacetylase (PgdA/CDA1 family)